MHSSSQAANEGGDAEEQLMCVSKGADAGRRPGDNQMLSSAGMEWAICARLGALLQRGCSLQI